MSAASPASPSARQPLSPRVRVALLVVAGVMVVAGAFTAFGGHRASRLDQAQAIAEDAGQFSGPSDSGLALVRISGLLRDEAEACAEAETDGARARRCRALFSGAGYTQVAAVGVLRCGRPELFDVRTAIHRYLVALEAEPATARLPRLPTCT